MGPAFVDGPIKHEAFFAVNIFIGKMIIKCEEKLREAREYATELSDKSLQTCLERLQSWEHDGRTIHLYKDFAPYSFSFRLCSPDDRLIMNGGLLYHGSPDRSCAVTFDHDNLWQTHT